MFYYTGDSSLLSTTPTHRLSFLSKCMMVHKLLRYTIQGLQYSTVRHDERGVNMHRRKKCV